MHKQLTIPEQPTDLSSLIMRFELSLERLGKASRFQFGDVVAWEIHSPDLLKGMRKAAELSLQQDGVTDVDLEIASALEFYPASPFLALRGLLNQEVLTKLVNRFEQELK